jgi:DNA-directed RNA polymerase specialized sigma24 family protein
MQSSIEQEVSEQKARGRKRDWTLSAESFDRLLSLLDSDRDRAGESYEQLRRTLTTFFDWRGCLGAEELADETLNRVARRLEEGEEIRNLQDYCHGIARYLALETLPKQSKVENEPESFQHLAAPSTDLSARLERERQFECLEKCMDELSHDERDLMLSYFSNERRTKIDNRINIADSMGTNLNALRVRVHRIKTRLEKCVTNCCNRKNAE